MLRLKVIEYVLQDGTNPFQRWFRSLSLEAAVKVALTKLESGNTSSIKWFEGIGEYRIDWGPGLRIYLARDGADIILLLGGGTKSRQNKDISIAIKLHKEFKQRRASDKLMKEDNDGPDQRV